MTPMPGRTRQSLIPKGSEAPLKTPAMPSISCRLDLGLGTVWNEVRPAGDQDCSGQNPDEVEVFVITRDTSASEGL